MIKFASGYKNQPEKDMYNARELALRRNQVKKYSLLVKEPRPQKAII